MLPSSRQTKIMAGSFDIACLTLPNEQQPVSVREAIALRIIGVTLNGECNPPRLREIGLNRFLRRARAASINLLRCWHRERNATRRSRFSTGHRSPQRGLRRKRSASFDFAGAAAAWVDRRRKNRELSAIAPMNSQTDPPIVTGAPRTLGQSVMTATISSSIMKSGLERAVTPMSVLGDGRSLLQGRGMVLSLTHFSMNVGTSVAYILRNTTSSQVALIAFSWMVRASSVARYWARMSPRWMGL